MNGVVLIQTDTTVGFVSLDAQKLAATKARPPEKPFLKTYGTFAAYSKDGRIPPAFRRELRRKKRTTYVVKGSAFRIVSAGPYHDFLKPWGWAYSTSANASGHRFDEAFAREKADLVVEDRRGLFEAPPSAIYKINHRKKKRIR